MTPYSIPLFKLNFDDLETEAITATIESKWISTGPRCEEFEKQFSEATGSQFAITTSNCTSSLHLALICAGIGPGDEVLCPSLTFAATVNAIKYTGATPVFCDITSVDDLNINPDHIRNSVTHATKAIMVMHFAGFPCNMDPIMSLAKEFHLKVIEDASHAPLSEYKGKKLGTIGDMGCFSFFSNKNISTGEGGMIVTNNKLYYEKAKLLRSHGMTSMSYQRATGHATSYDIQELGYNYRLDDMRASIGIVQLKKLKKDLLLREEVRKLYISLLRDQKKIAIPFLVNKEFVSNYIFPIVLKNSTKSFRDTIRNHLHSSGIQTSIHYPAVHKFSVYQHHCQSLPLTEYVSENEITLPLYGSLKSDEIQYICSTLIKALNNEK